MKSAKWIAVPAPFTVRTAGPKILGFCYSNIYLADSQIALTCRVLMLSEVGASQVPAKNSVSPIRYSYREDATTHAGKGA
jgi:hypothetical protein